MTLLAVNSNLDGNIYLAGTPAQSNTTSAPLPSVKPSTTSLRFSSIGFTTCVAPNCFEKFCLDAATSETIISLTFLALRHRIIARPMGPPPRIVTFELELISGAAEIACQDTESGSTSAPISRGTFLGSGKTCVALQQTASDSPPPPPLKPTNPPV